MITVKNVASTDSSRQRDLIYARQVDEVASFTFDEKVAAVFPDMIKRSVPGYSSVIAMTGVLAARYARAGSVCYDLGCSLGESSYAMLRQIQVDDCRVIGIDNSEQMLEKCRMHLNEAQSRVPFDLLCDDILNVDFQPCSVAVLNYTLQFIDKQQRDELIKRIYEKLLPGGLLLLSEKICFADEALNRRMIDLHHAFKKANGYSDLEISQKRTALENVLIPEYPQTHSQRLQKAGFEKIDTWFQCFNFASFVAIKPGT